MIKEIRGGTMELKVISHDASHLAKHDNEAFALLRRAGFGASDSSVLLGVNPFPNNTLADLIKQKQSNTMTDNERAIGQMVNVRKGSDLEPIILEKFIEKFNIQENKVEKPTAMYRIGDTPLTVNFDGIWEMPMKSFRVPVECKFVSTYGGKYYQFEKSIDHYGQVYDLMNLGVEVNNIYLMRRAEEAGIPIYYYTQVQQQLLALGAPFGYLAALVDKDWTLRVFPVVADAQVQLALMEVAEEQWKLI